MQLTSLHPDTIQVGTAIDAFHQAQVDLAAARSGEIPPFEELTATQKATYENGKLVSEALTKSSDPFVSRNASSAVAHAEEGLASLGSVINYLDPDPNAIKPAVMYSKDQLVASLVNAADAFQDAEASFYME